MPYTKTSPDKRQQLLSPAAFGIHYLVMKDLQKFFEEKLGHSTFFFYEFFLEKPYARWDKIDSPLYETQAVTAPFLSREIYKTGFIPALNIDTLKKLNTKDDIEMVPLTQETLQKYWADINTMRLRIEHTDLLRALLEIWLDSTGVHMPGYFTPDAFIYKNKGKDDVVATAGGLSADYMRGEYIEETIKRAKTDDDFAEAALAKLREFTLVLRPWLRSSSIKEIGFVSPSLSTDALFWGECIVLFPVIGDFDWREEQAWLRELTDLLFQRVRSTYTPMLALLENYIYEDELREKLKDVKSSKAVLRNDFIYRKVNKAWVTKNSAYLREIGSGKKDPYGKTGYKQLPSNTNHVYLSLLNHCTKNSALWKTRLSKLERALVELWADRLGIIPTSPLLVKESLVFAKYLIASPAMVDRTLQAISLRHMAEDKKKGKERAVKTALVVGGPGSGKDSMAQLIRLFSPGYRFGPTKTFNMAVFRPKEAAVPLLLGLEAPYRGEGGAESRFSVSGVLHRSVIGALKSPGSGKDQERGFTFVLDELNSLDMDTQGALLRLLENAELQPLGGLESTLERMDLLIIGVMNEDPQTIMKRRTMERVIREKQFFGGLLGEVLYELFRSQRRLRDDLYYRLIRGGEIHIPELRERREDIPILFHFIVSQDLRPLIPDSVKSNLEIELPVYEALVDNSLQWEGNLRELQTLARRIVVAAVNEYEARGAAGDILTIRGSHARESLREHQRSTGINEVG